MSAADEELPGQEQLEFLDEIWGGPELPGGFVQIVRKREDEHGKRTGAPVDDKWFMWPAERERIGRYVESKLDDTLYFAVPVFDAPKRQADHFKYQKAIYVDDDGVTGKWNLEPTFTVVSSPGHQHAYWVLDNVYTKEDTQRIGRDISRFHQHDNEFHEDLLAADAKAGNKPHKFCGTDPGGWDSTQILRMPGSVNNKPEYGEGFVHTVSVEPGSGAFYSIDDMREAYPDAGEPLVLPPSPDKIPDDMPDSTDMLAQLGNRNDLIDLIYSEPTGRGNSQGWDERLFALENELFRLGYTAEEVFAIAKISACNKFRRGVRNPDGVTFSPRPNPDLDLWRDVLKAQQTYDSSGHVGWDAPTYNRNSVVDLEGNIVEEAVKVKGREKFSLNLLDEDERARANKHLTFIDRYVKWASSKTDAATVYHEASAFTILSTIFGEFGHAFPKFGKLRLNLWFLVMGKTTRARKSTSRGLMMRIIDGMMDHEYHYDEGSEFTGEGVRDTLLEKDRRSSLIHKDEVQGLFKAIATKNYMADVNDRLTEWYDGKVAGKMAAGGNNKDGAETNLVMFFMGIVGKITSVLTLEDFQSGFLARFLHVIGEAPERTRESEWLDQASLSEIASGDPVYIDLLADLAIARAYWREKVPAFLTVPIIFEEDAWRRWNDANWELQESIRHHERAEILEAAVDRMGKSAIKAAALIAMSEQRDRVNLDDVLVALKYASVWATHMVESAEMISASFFRKDMQTLVNIILTKGGAIKYEEAYSRMDKEPNQFKTIVDGCVLSGEVMVRVDIATKVRWLEATGVNYA